jgi:hypothetical protein
MDLAKETPFASEPTKMHTGWSVELVGGGGVPHGPSP